MTRRHRNAASGRFAAARDAEADPERHVAERVREPVVDIRAERMSGGFLKIHLGTPDKPRVLHYFTAPDHGDPHNHAQFGFWSTVLDGDYVEERYVADGSFQLIHRQPGDRFYVSPDDIHRIVDLPAGMAVTLIEPDPHTGRDSGFFRWRDGVMLHRTWREASNGEDFRPVR